MTACGLETRPHPGTLAGMRRALLMAAALPALALALDEEGYPDQGRAGWGAFLVRPPIEVLAEHDLLPGEGGLVVRVRPGGTADRLGLQEGDVVLALNGQAVASRRDVRAVLQTVQPGDPAVAVVSPAAGGMRVATGTFQERRPRPPGMGGPPPWMMPWAFAGGPPMPPPEQDAASQYRQLIAMRDEQRAAAAALAELRGAAPAPGVGAWFVSHDYASGGGR